MNDNKKISVIIPNFNKSKYLRDCIKSVIDQTYKNIEIIIVDDHSTDNSLDIINEMLDKYGNIRLIALQKNGGVCNARNVGVKESSGEYVTFLDSDDIYINKDKIKNEMNIVDTYKIAFSQFVFMKESGDVINFTKVTRNEYRSKSAVADILAISKPSYKQLRGYVFSKKLFYEIGGYSFDRNLYEDLDLLLRLALKARFVYTGEIGEGYRLNTGGLSNVSYDKAASTIDIIRKKYFRQFNFLQKTRYRRIQLARKYQKWKQALKTKLKKILFSLGKK